MSLSKKTREKAREGERHGMAWW